MTDIIKTIKATKEVFVDVSLNSTSIWVKVDKKNLLAQLAAFDRDLDDEMEIVTQYGRSAVYLARKLG